MSGFGVLLWMAIGSATGWVISRLMVLADDDALRGTAAGTIGGILGGFGARFLDASPAAGGDAPGAWMAALLALAGALWSTWTTCVVTSGPPRAPFPPTAPDRPHAVGQLAEAR